MEASAGAVQALSYAAAMLVRVVVALHTGGRYNVRPHEITFDIEVPVGVTTLMFDTLKRKCCEQLEGHNTLFGYNLTFCRVREGGWEALDGGRVELQQLQQQQHPGQQQLDMELCAMVVPTSLSPGRNHHTTLLLCCFWKPCQKVRLPLNVDLSTGSIPDCSPLLCRSAKPPTAPR